MRTQAFLRILDRQESQVNQDGLCQSKIQDVQSCVAGDKRAVRHVPAIFDCVQTANRRTAVVALPPIKYPPAKGLCGFQSCSVDATYARPNRNEIPAL